MYCKNCGEPLNENQAVCLKCGVAAGNGKGFCPNCGSAVNEEAAFCVNCGVALTPEAAKPKRNTAGLAPRSLVTAIILTIITCGIYSIYWFICLTNEMNQLADRTNDTKGGMALLLTIVTCGIYNYYWAYKMGEKRDTVANENGSTPILYLLLTLFGFGIIVYALAQDTINKAIAEN